MNKFFAFLWVHTIIFGVQGDDADAPSRAVDFGSWSKFAQSQDVDDQDNIERSVENSSQDEDEQKKGNNDE